MRLAQDAIRQDLDGIQNTAGELPPPSVLTPLLAYTRGQADHVVASHESSESGTTWYVVASVGHSLIVVDASSPRPEWTLGDPRDDGTLADGERRDAQLRPLGDVAAVHVVGTTSVREASREWSFNAQWRLTLRDGTHVDIRAGRRTDTAREACDEFARHIIDAIAST